MINKQDDPEKKAELNEKENSKLIKKLSQSLKASPFITLSIALSIIIGLLLIIGSFTLNLPSLFNLLPTIVIPFVPFIWQEYKERLATKKEEEERKERGEEEERKQRLAQIIEEHKSKRIEAIEQTFDHWKQINDLLSAVRFVKLDESDIRNVQLKIASQSIEFAKIIYLWSSRFPILPSLASRLFVSYTNVLYWSAWGIAYYLRCIIDPLFPIQISKQQADQKKNNTECIELQEALGIFQRGVVRISLMHLLYVLKYSDQLLEYIETYFEDEQMQNEFINRIRRIIEEFTNIFEKEKGEYNGVKYLELYEELEHINKYRSEYIKHYKGNNQDFVPVPIRLHWYNFKKKKQQFEERIELDTRIDNILGEMEKEINIKDRKMQDTKMKKEINIKDRKKQHTKIQMISEIKEKIGEETKREMQTNIMKLINELAYLKIYELLLFIDKFQSAEIAPPSKNRKLSMNGDSDELRKSFQSINKKIRDGISEPEKFIYSSDEIDTIYEHFNKIYNKTNNIEGDLKSAYKDFVSLFKHKDKITPTTLMNIGADDITEYVKISGREIRFSNTLSPEDDMAPVS